MLLRIMLAGSLLVLGLFNGTSTYAQNPVHTPPPDTSCPGDKVVWVNTMTRVYHHRGERYFGNTIQGKFTCEATAVREGNRSSQ